MTVSLSEIVEILMHIILDIANVVVSLAHLLLPLPLTSLYILYDSIVSAPVLMNIFFFLSWWLMSLFIIEFLPLW